MSRNDVKAQIGKAGAGPVEEEARRLSRALDIPVKEAERGLRSLIARGLVVGPSDEAGAGPVGEALRSILYELRQRAADEANDGLSGETACARALSAYGWLGDTIDAFVSERVNNEASPMYTGYLIENLRNLAEMAPAKSWRAMMLLEAAFTIERLAARPVEEPGEVERITRERNRATGLWRGASERAETAEAALAETRERLEKVEAAAEKNGRAGIEAAARYVEALWSAHTKEFGIYDPSTNATEFSGPSEDIDCLYQELIEGIRSLDAARVDRTRAALTGDAQEAGR